MPQTKAKIQNFSFEEKVIGLQRANFAEMWIVADIIRSSREWYRNIVNERDFSEHDPDVAWIHRNFQRREFYLGTDGSKHFGTISLQPIGSWLYLGYIYLNIDFVGKGLGHVLMDFARKQAVSRGFKGMALISHPQATWAVRAYNKFGFHRVAKEKTEVLEWEHGALQPYYEEGFHLYQYLLPTKVDKIKLLKSF